MRILAYALLAIACVATAMAADIKKPGVEPVRFPKTYDLADLPVWRVDAKGGAEFDPIILITYVRSTVAPETWADGAVIAADKNKPTRIIVAQTQENHDKISKAINTFREAAQPADRKKRAN